MESIPPTSAALKLHIRRSALQVNCWDQGNVSKQLLYEPTKTAANEIRMTGTQSGVT